MSFTDLILNAGQTAGYIIIFLIIFAECGLFFGFFLPGDSLLLAIGILAAQGHFSIVALLVLCVIASILGNQVGYLFGKRIGPALFNKTDSPLFRKQNIQRAHNFYEKYGAPAILLSRFVPIVRTFAPIIAGIGTMRYGTFLFYNIVGGVFWITSITLAGYYVGYKLEGIDTYILPVIMVIVIISCIPGLLHLLRPHHSDPSDKD